MQTIYPKVMMQSIPQGILPGGLLSSMIHDMDESPTRIARLQSLINGERFSTQAALAAVLEVQPDYLSRMFKGMKRLTGDMAREYEERLGLPKYWLDGDEAPSNISAQAREIAHRFDKLTPSQQVALIGVIESYSPQSTNNPQTNNKSSTARQTQRVQNQSSGSS